MVQPGPRDRTVAVDAKIAEGRGPSPAYCGAAERRRDWSKGSCVSQDPYGKCPASLGARSRSVRPISGRHRGVVRSLAPALALSLLTVPETAGGQTTDGAQGWYIDPALAVGPSFFLAELWESSQEAAGIGVRGGVRTPYGDIVATLETWPDVRSFHITTILIEASYLLRPRERVTPFLLLGLGHARSRYHGDASRWTNLDGTAASFGLGLEWTTGRWLDVRTEGLLRTDDGGYNGAIRMLVGWTPDRGDPAPLPMARHVDVVAYWMTPVSGPWRFVEPGYGFRVSRIHDRLGGSLTFAIFHWQIPGEAFLRDYVWDTRAFVAQPALEWHPRKLQSLAVRGGPVITMMGEGPGNGASLGGHLEAAWAPSWTAPFSVGAGWLWMRHDTEDARYTAADQHGLMLFGGLHF